jgi:hypothetical protein
MLGRWEKEKMVELNMSIIINFKTLYSFIKRQLGITVVKHD